MNEHAHSHDHETWATRHDDGNGQHFHMADTDLISERLTAAGAAVTARGDQQIAGRPTWVIEVG